MGKRKRREKRKTRARDSESWVYSPELAAEVLHLAEIFSVVAGPDLKEADDA